MRKSHRRPKEVESLLRQFCCAEGCDAAGTRLPAGSGVRGLGVAVDTASAEVAGCSEATRFHVLVDGEVFGPFHRIRITPLRVDGKAVRMPVMLFNPPARPGSC
jgi:hypothetical protein